ncbi:MAG: isoprenylcysteine carboxylmethyltransferase family protein [Verrucomicrobiota bacterium]|nr:isoprenylcysteine carboxylmethyltransferase family protein [Verrucomicrobiota bacterium]
MQLPGPQHLGLIYLLSEVLLSITHRSRGDGVRQDRSTLRLLWLVILLSVGAGLYVAVRWQAAALPHRQVLRAVAVVIFAAGLLLRWWAISTLGRFFTVDVQIARDHDLVDRGPFRVVRHPSYTGVLLAFLGFALSLANWAALLVILVPIFVVFLRRMDVEEQALTTALGERYVRYMERTKRLLPGIY